jgi:hypothetical protein
MSRYKKIRSNLNLLLGYPDGKVRKPLKMMSVTKEFGQRSVDKMSQAKRVEKEQISKKQSLGMLTLKRYARLTKTNIMFSFIWRNYT